MKLTSKQLKKLIREVASEQLDVDPDAETASRVAQAFSDLLLEDGDAIGSNFKRILDYSLGDDSYFPVRIEDIEPMANAVSERAVALITQDPEFKEWITRAVAKTFRSALN